MNTNTTEIELNGCSDSHDMSKTMFPYLPTWKIWITIAFEGVCE